jgi:hypothetical protein
MEKSVEEIIEEWREIIENNPDKFTEIMMVLRSDIEEIIKYFDAIDDFRNMLRK